MGQFLKNYKTFYQKNCQKALENMVLGSGFRKKPIPDPGVKQAPDPGSGSATLLRTIESYNDCFVRSCMCLLYSLKKQYEINLFSRV